MSDPFSKVLTELSKTLDAQQKTDIALLNLCRAIADSVSALTRRIDTLEQDIASLKEKVVK